MAATILPAQVSSYLQYLPAIFQEDADQQGVSFLGRFLLAFEQILSGPGDLTGPALEERVDALPTYFIPLAGDSRSASAGQAPAEFLPWLARWVALALREDWEEEEQRRFLASVVPLYRLRGTPAGLREMLHIYTGMGVETNELLRPMQIGATSTVGIDTAVGGGAPHYFIVKLILTSDNPDIDPNYHRRVRIARAIIDQEKPAHTYYDLQIVLPAIQIGAHSTVGKDTLIGTPPS